MCTFMICVNVNVSKDNRELEIKEALVGTRLVLGLSHINIHNGRLLIDLFVYFLIEQ